MAIAKDILIHSSPKGGMADVENCMDYVKNQDKVDLKKFLKNMPESNDIQSVLDYSQNPDKTIFTTDGDEDILVSGYLCTPETAAQQFQWDQDAYHDLHGYKNLGKKKDKDGNEVEKEEVVAHHIIQSFEYDKTLDPRFVHWLGLEFVKRAFPGCRAVISTHMNTKHLHNHIIVCAYEMDGSRKIGMNQEKRKRYRAVNDEISLEYGLPILLGNENSQSKGYYEWMLEQDGSSWKQSLRNDIKEAVQMAESWEDYVDIMEGNGYTLNQHGDFVTYTVPAALSKNGKFQSRMVRDTTLGAEFCRGRIEEKLSQHASVLTGPSKDKQDVLHKDFREQATYRLHFNINRYDNTGRRRSDLEIMILKAIKIIKHFIGNEKYWNPDYAAKFSSPVWADPNKKLARMEETLRKIQESGIESSADLLQKMNEVGIELSQTKRERKDLENVIDSADHIVALINHVQELQQNPTISNFDYGNLYIPQFTADEVRAEKAKAMPMTAQQRRELFLAFQNSSDWVLLERYDKLSYEDAKACLDFLNGKTDKKPDIVADSGNALEIKYKKMADNERTSAKMKLSKLSTNERQKKIAQELASAKGFVINTDSLSKYQFVQILNCYSSNPFVSSPIASGKLKEELTTELRKRKMQIGRDVTESEATQILNYFKSDGKAEMPTVLKDSSPIRQTMLIQIKELLELRNQTCSIPLESLTEADGYKLRDLLLYQGTDPDMESEGRLYAMKFFDAIKDMPIEETGTLCEYRDCVRDLAKMGVSLQDIGKIKEEKKQVIAEYDSVVEKEKDLTERYNNFKSISYDLSLAQNKSFTAGLLANSADIKIGVEEIEPSKKKEIGRDEEHPSHSS